MFRLFALMLAVFASTAALAQTAFDPKIAYTSYEGNADNLYVANSDGSNRFIVYKVGKVRLGAIDMAPVDAADPGLRKIAFTQSGVLKMVRFRVFAAGPSVLDVTSLDAVGAPYQGAILPDFSPDGSKLVYIKKTPTINGTEPTDIYIVSASGTGSKLVWSATLSGGTYISSVRWTGAYEFIFLVGGLPGSVQQVNRVTVDINNDVYSTPQTLFTDEDPYFTSNYLFGIEDLDVARTRSSLVFTTGTPPSSKVRTVVEYTFPNGNVAGSFRTHLSNSNGMRSHFSSDDTHILYLHMNLRASNVFDSVNLYDTNFPNSIVSLAAKGGQFGYADTRP